MLFTQLHQKVILALIAGLTIVAISGIFAYSQRKSAAALAGQQVVQQPKEIDTGDADKDGAPDWQEILYGTDPNNPDTDGNGAGDKTKIDELKKARFAQFEEGVQQGSVPAATTTTEVAADTLIGAYFLKQQTTESGEVPKKDRDIIVKKTIQTLNKLDYTTFTQEQIKVINDSSPETVIKYRNGVQTALKKLEVIPEYELQIYARAVDKNDPKEFQNLADAAKLYETLATELSNMKVPAEVAEYHLQYINSYMYTAAALKGMAKGFDDVIGSYRALGHFGKAEQQFRMAQQSLQVYFALKNIDPL